MRLISYIIIAVISSAFTAWMFTGGHLIGPSKALNPPTFELTYSDFVSILLTVLGVVLAALAIVVGIVAFRTIGEIKREAERIAKEHSKAEVERSLEAVPGRVAKAVEGQVNERLPAAIDLAVEKAGREGRLDEALQKAMMQFSAGGGVMNTELQPDFEKPSDEENTNA